MHTDASLRFERGVDPSGQGRAVERATELLIEVSGGKAGPLVVETSPAHVPQTPNVTLRRSRLAQLLGTEVDDGEVSGILERLQLSTSCTADGWDVVVPPHRFDITIEADLIEEVARIHGYDRIPETTETASTPLEPVTESRVEFDRVSATLTARDYEEVVTYSFVDRGADEAVSGIASQLELSNPIASTMSVMRASLWPGLLEAAANNLARQQERVRVFEIGKSFHGSLEDRVETLRIAGVVTGPAVPEQWGSKARAADFFDVKADVEALLALTGKEAEFDFDACDHPALQPGQAARIERNGEIVGFIGKIHPTIARQYELKNNVFAFELDAEKACASDAPVAKEISRFPAIRRDIAVIVDEKIPARDLVRVAASAAPSIVRDVRIFDVYQGPGIEAGLKSVAIGLILQETSRTLTDGDADAAQAAAVQKLQQEFAAVLRD